MNTYNILMRKYSFLSVRSTVSMGIERPRKEFITMNTSNSGQSRHMKDVNRCSERVEGPFKDLRWVCNPLDKSAVHIAYRTEFLSFQPVVGNLPCTYVAWAASSFPKILGWSFLSGYILPEKKGRIY